MQLILNNPYRITGLLVGATAKEQDRQIRRLKQYIEAEQVPQDDFSFPTLGSLKRTLETIGEAASKLNLDNDRMQAALFWFYNGNSITDEPAFVSLKEADLDQVLEIWTKLTSKGEVSQRNASAFNNLGTLYLSGILEGTNTNEALLEQGISLKLKFLESNFIKDFKALTTDKTYNTTIKELQIQFLNQLFFEIEKNEKINSNQFINILSKLDFAAKVEFLKCFIEKPLEEIEKRIEESKIKRKLNKANSIKIGEELFKQINSPLNLLKSILGISNLKYTSISDKAANEILQCSIEYFNFNKEKSNDDGYIDNTLKLAKIAKNVSIGKLTKDRIEENIFTLEEIKDSILNQVVEFLYFIKNKFEETSKKIKDELSITSPTLLRKYIIESFDWVKINKYLNEILTEKNLINIKASKNNFKKNEFLGLLQWLALTTPEQSSVFKIIQKYIKIPPKLPFKIISSELINDAEMPLYTKFTRKIGLRLNVETLEESSLFLKLKFIDSAKKIYRENQISPDGFTIQKKINLNLNTRLVNLPLWGSDDKCIFKVGKNTIEVYYEDFVIHSFSFYIELAPSDKLKEINDTIYYEDDLIILKTEMDKIKEWQFLRSQSERERQISEQEYKITKLTQKGKNEKLKHINKQKEIIDDLKHKIKNAKY